MKTVLFKTISINPKLEDKEREEKVQEWLSVMLTQHLVPKRIFPRTLDGTTVGYDAFFELSDGKQGAGDAF